MEADATRPDIPESAIEHLVTYDSHWIENWVTPNPFVAVLLARLSGFGVTLKDFSFTQDTKNVSEVALVVSVPKLRSTVRVGLDQILFRAANPDWDIATELVALFDSALDACNSLIRASIRSQVCTLAFHVTPGSLDFGLASAKLVNTQVLGPSEFYGVAVNKEGNALEIERSLKYAGGAFFRIVRSFEPEVKFADVALALHSQEVAALNLLGVRDLV